MVCSAVPRPPAAGEMRPVTFVACLAGLNEDCETTLATIAKALHGTGDDVLLVATPNVPISPATKALGDLAPVKLAYVPWGTDLAAQYHAALAAASHEDVVVISPGVLSWDARHSTSSARWQARGRPTLWRRKSAPGWGATAPSCWWDDGPSFAPPAVSPALRAPLATPTARSAQSAPDN